MSTEHLVKTGMFSLQLLYVGSKSEGVFPVVESEDGTSALVRVQGERHDSSHDPLTPFYNQRVRVTGEFDHQMGHLRLTLQFKEQCIQGIELIPMIPGSED